ncbi:Putative flagellar protein [Thermobacillus xylanilyticus]|uniref:Flagellar protein n=2 Tax=Thermobacillus xylanilyticus TaxID=76633 RepID=A0ABN7S5E8_THEXY|nr:Putative flagellar protein [Thermobacillus xylanilyticus]
MCGKVFQVNLRNLCNECAEIHDRRFEAVDRYLMKNRHATTEQTAEEDGT